MALGPRLDLRQTQSLVMTPQLQQAIKLLALSNLEIEAFIGEALETNPLLEAGELSLERPLADAPVAEEAAPDPTADELIARGAGEADAPLDIDPTALDRDRDTGDWSAAGGGGDEGPTIDERGEHAATLAQHLEAQIGTAEADPQLRFVAIHLIGLLDEAGYLHAPLREVAGDLGVPLASVEAALAVVQSLDPTGIGARTLSECLALQAIEADRYDPCMQRLIANLEMVARGEFARLKRMCGVDDEDFADMLNELRGYDPKPGLRIGSGERAPVALDQRQKTILKVAAEIVKQQDGFFRRGVSELRPLTLRTVAEAISMHESTVSRVTSNKYLLCNRGTFELKYFFTSGVARVSGSGEGAEGEGVSAEAVKAQIRALCDAEDTDDVLSDDKLVELLRDKGFDLARRTVAKYREAIGIGSSVQRRRQKKLARVA
ncbi:MAG: hypothetical protein B7Z08_06730 [Sphingomonadales bacterium 32-68-7]|nr:MAG: hypothetical protein B7Z08_06730 [Sphingomonadales bacterium 32-68-7]